MTNEEAKEVLKEQIDRYGQEYDSEGIEALNMAIQALEQSRPKGKWKILDECANEGVYCSKCHKTVFKLEFSHTMKWRNFKYCPNCGARMEVEK